VHYAPGQWVWLRLLHRPAASLDVRGRGKLGPRFFGPFQVLEQIGDVAYKLRLPAGARIHDVFHVGLLKPFHGEPPTQVQPLPAVRHGRVLVEPEEVLRSRLARGHRELLVRWKGAPATETSWVSLVEFQQLFPKFQLEDELLVQGGEMSWSDFSTRGVTNQDSRRRDLLGLVVSLFSGLLPGLALYKSRSAVV